MITDVLLRTAIAAVRSRTASPTQLHSVARGGEDRIANAGEKALIDNAHAALLFMRCSRTVPVDDSVWEAVEAVCHIAERALDPDTVLTRKLQGSKGAEYTLTYRPGRPAHHCSCPAHTLGPKRGTPCKHMDRERTLAGLAPVAPVAPVASVASAIKGAA